MSAKTLTAFVISLVASGAIAASTGCSTATEEEPAASTDVNATAGAATSALVTDRPTLRALEGRGFGLNDVVFDDPTATTTAALYERHPLYRSYVAAVEGDLAEEHRIDPTAVPGFAGSHRLFDARFLHSTGTSFELVGVVNRMDRLSAHPGTCGEVRLVYRLTYPESAMPLTLNVIFTQPPVSGGCATTAKRWVLPSERGTTLANALAAGPLSHLSTASSRRSALVQVETNFQSVRWPASVAGSMGGLGLYVLRVFRVDGDAFVAKRLENTPDAAALKDPAKKRRMLDWLKGRTNDLAAGRPILMPAALDDLLAEKAISVAPRSLERQGNRIFSQILDADDLLELGAHTAGEREHLLRTLDTGTCNGCHQTRSLAGFHLLGEDVSFDEKDWLNKLAVGRSAHLLDEDALRVVEVASLARGQRPPARAPAPERPAQGRSTLHAHCVMPDGTGHLDPAFASWTCGAGQRCDTLDPGSLVGSCEKDRPSAVGDACEPGHVVSSTDPRRETLTRVPSRACHAPSGVPAGTVVGSSVCSSSSPNGFPGGVCLTGCSSIGALVDGGESVCTSLPKDVTPCVQAGNRLLDCIGRDLASAFIQSCDEDRPCREEYACARVAGTKPGTGACMPPYFLQQIRNDGHVLAADPCAQKSNGLHCANARDLVMCAAGHAQPQSSVQCGGACVQTAKNTPPRCEE